MRCAFIVVPDALEGRLGGKSAQSRNPLEPPAHDQVQRRLVSCSAAPKRSTPTAADSEIAQLIDFYLANAKLIREGLAKLGLNVYGGVNAPYVWVTTPKGIDQWSFFDRLLDRANVVGTPGTGFGACGEGYLRHCPRSASARTSSKRYGESVPPCSRRVTLPPDRV